MSKLGKSFQDEHPEFVTTERPFVEVCILRRVLLLLVESYVLNVEQRHIGED